MLYKCFRKWTKKKKAWYIQYLIESNMFYLTQKKSIWTVVPYMCETAMLSLRTRLTLLKMLMPLGQCPSWHFSCFSTAETFVASSVFIPIPSSGIFLVRLCVSPLTWNDGIDATVTAQLYNTGRAKRSITKGAPWLQPTMS